jgi:hypothetical protein
MRSVFAGTLMIAALASSPATSQPADCPLPSEWGSVSKIGDWRVSRTCSTRADVLRISAQVDHRQLSLRCDAERGPYGDIVAMNAELRGPVRLALEGTAVQAMSVAVSEVGAQVYLNDVALTKRFMAALVDGHGPITLVLTSSDKRELELVFPRNGLAEAAKPLRTRCAW